MPGVHADYPQRSLSVTALTSLQNLNPSDSVLRKKHSPIYANANTPKTLPIVMEVISNSSF